MKKKLTPYLFLLFSAIFLLNTIGANAITYITSCQDISSPGYYMLRNNISAEGTCITISSSDVILDGNGRFWIKYANSTTGNAIYSSSDISNITIKNLHIKQLNASVSSAYAIHVRKMKYSTIKDTTIETNGQLGIGIFLKLQSQHNIIENVNITTSGSSAYGIELGSWGGSSPDNNTIKNVRINTTGSNGWGILLTGTNPPKNTTIINANVQSKYYALGMSTANVDYQYVYVNDSILNFTTSSPDIRGDGNATVILTNTTFEGISFGSSSYAKFYIKHYVDVYVNDTAGNPISNANVKAYDVFNNLAFNTTTNESGWIQRQAVIDYMQNRTTTISYNNYTITASKQGYIAYQNATANVTDNLIKDNNNNPYVTLASIPVYTINYPENNSYINVSYAILNITPTDATETNLIVWFFGNGSLLNVTNAINGTYTTYNWSGLSDGYYSWYVVVSNGITNSSQNTSFFTIDTTTPSLTINYPKNNSNLSVSWLNITGTASDTNPEKITINESQFGNNQGNYTNWNFTASSIDEGHYAVKITANDSAGNENSSVIFFTIDRTAPTISQITNVPNTNTKLDPGVTINITANITDALTGIQKATLQWKNATGNWNNVTMNYNASSGFYYASFTTGGESNYTYRIIAKDHANNTRVSSEKTLSVFWDCTWQVSPSDMGAIAGWDETKNVGNITIINTGDSMYSQNNCSIDFSISHSTNLQPCTRLYFDSHNTYTSDCTLLATYTVNAGQNKTIAINATFLNSFEDVNVIITLEDVTNSGTNISNQSKANVSLNLVSIKEGPYLYNKITNAPTSLYLTNQTFNLSAYLKNINGNGSNINTAYNVSFNWTLPSYWLIKSGTKNKFYDNLTNASPVYNNLVIEFNSTNLPSLSPGVYNVSIKSMGFNMSGMKIIHSGNRTYVEDSAQILLSCYSNSDGICVSACSSSLDPDCTSSGGQQKGTGQTSGGGGGGAGTPSKSKFKRTGEVFEIVRGQQNSFEFYINNSYDGILENVKIDVLGEYKDYITINPKEIDRIMPGDFAIVIVTIKAPAYFSEGKYDLIFKIDSKLVKNNSITYKVTETKVITLYVLEMSKQDALELLNKCKEMVKSMNESGMFIDDVKTLLEEAKKHYEDLLFSKLKKSYENIKNIYDAAFEALRLINTLQEAISKAEEQGIAVKEAKKLLYLAEAAFKRGDFIAAKQRAKQAQLVYALETKGAFNLLHFIKNNPGETFGTLLGIIFFSFALSLLIKRDNYKRQLRNLEEEERLLLDLIKAVQKETFENKTMSMGEYRQAISQYETRLAEIVEKRIRLEALLSNMLKLKSKETALKQEKNRIINLIKKLQDDYLNKGIIDTRVYQNMMKSYSARLSEIEEEIAFLEAQKKLKKV